MVMVMVYIAILLALRWMFCLGSPIALYTDGQWELQAHVINYVSCGSLAHNQQ